MSAREISRVHGKVLFAKPETGIGLFPDVGRRTSWGACPAPRRGIALTGARLEDLVSGLATHFVSSALVDKLCAALGEIPADTRAEDRAAAVEAVLESFAARSPAPAVEANSTLARHRDPIDACFAAPDVEGILAELAGVARGSGAPAAFAQETIETLQRMSLTSLKITLEQVRRGVTLDSLGECLKMEFRMCQRLMQDKNSDFYEGIRAVLVDRDRRSPVGPGGARRRDAGNGPVCFDAARRRGAQL